MNRSALVPSALYLCALVALTAGPEARGGETGSDPPTGIKAPVSWLRTGVEMRGRVEFNLDPDQDLDDRLYLNRLRLNVEARPNRWLRFVFQGQDTRALSLNPFTDCQAARDALDLRLGYAELGRAEDGWQVRVGRQELAIGDERLVAADNYWDAFGQSFDAVRVGFARKALRLDAFTGFRVQPARRRPDPFDTASRISGISAQWNRGERGIVLEPYVLWKRGGDSFDLMERPGHRDVVTPGMRAQGNLAGGLDYNVEMALQRGHVVGDGISAWAGHWELGWKPPGAELGPRIGLEFNFASGDADPGDRRHGTFDDLYPAGFNRYGITDPFAWRNIRYPAVGADLPLTRRWSVAGGFRCYWLATVHDGLYPGGDQFMLRNPGATRSHIGNQVFLSTSYTRSERWRVSGGYGHLFAGSYLRQSAYRSGFRTLYLLTSFAF